MAQRGPVLTGGGAALTVLAGVFWGGCDAGPGAAVAPEAPAETPKPEAPSPAKPLPETGPPGEMEPAPEPNTEPSAGAGGATNTPSPSPETPEGGNAPLPPPEPTAPMAHPVSFSSQELRAQYYAEGCASGDLTGDGNTDLLLGPLIYAGPDFSTAHEIETAKVYDYGDRTRRHFMSFTHDVDRDGLLDAVSIGYIGTDARWYKNPGPELATEGHWQSFTISEGVGGEAPLLADLVGDDALELVFIKDGRLGFASAVADPTLPWEFQPVSERRSFDHGLGVGDIDGDGDADIVEKSAWYEQGASPATWVRHPVDFTLGGEGGGNMLVVDLDEDGDSDVVASLNGHGYGLYWFEQEKQGEAIRFVPHEILPKTKTETNFSQLHALGLADFNGDGLVDLVTGKRWWAHQGADPGANDPAVVFWFEQVRADNAAPEFVGHLVNDDSGIGLQVCSDDLNQDGRPDIAASNKKGMFLHLQAPGNVKRRPAKGR